MAGKAAVGHGASAGRAHPTTRLMPDTSLLASMPEVGVEQMQSGIVVRNTFIDLHDPVAKDSHSTFKVRSYSCGDLPSMSSDAITSEDLRGVRRASPAEGFAEPARDSRVLRSNQEVTMSPIGDSPDLSSEHREKAFASLQGGSHTFRKVKQQLNLEELLGLQASQSQQWASQESLQSSRVASPCELQLDRLITQPAEPRCTRAALHATCSDTSHNDAPVVWSIFDDPAHLERIPDVDVALQMASADAVQVSLDGTVFFLHSIAKLAEQEAFGRIADLSAVITDSRFTALVLRLRRMVGGLEAPRSITRTMWAFGKLGVWSTDVEVVVLHISQVAPPHLHQFSPHELSTVLWTLARFQDTGHLKRQKYTELTMATVRECAARLSAFSSAQCLTNALWAVAKLDGLGQEAEQFAVACVERVQALMFQEMSPQGLANSLWACAKLGIDCEVVSRFCYDAARRATASADLLGLFFPQELSMAAWAMAKLLGRRSRSGVGRVGIEQVRRFLLSVAVESQRRIQEFSPQGISNVAWALATLDLVRCREAAQFCKTAACVAEANISKFPPQAIANLCWALSRDSRSQDFSAFGQVAAREALVRPEDFSWQDLSGMVSALTPLGLQGVSEVHQLTHSLIDLASRMCPQIGTQALLNLALAATRLKVSRETLSPLVWGIAEILLERVQSLNDIDLRQWSEVQRYCNLPGSSSLGNQARLTQTCAQGSRSSIRRQRVHMPPHSKCVEQDGITFSL